MPRVVIVGGGFGGLYAARALAKAPVDVTVVDRTNHHVFQPLLYQVATASLSPSQVAYPIRAVLRRQRNTRVIMGEVTSVDTARRIVTLTDGSVPYDFLILAPGARHSYFGHPEWESRAPGLKTLDDALGIRERILMAFERAERETEAGRRRALLTFVVVVGDLAACVDAAGRPLPGLAPVAIQQGEYAARAVAAAVRGEGRKPFRYRDRGTMATIGRNAAVVSMRRLRLSGYPAWLLWCLVHILWLIGFRNRFLVMTEWAWAYLRFDRSARLITRTVEDERAGPGAGQPR